MPLIGAVAVAAAMAAAAPPSSSRETARPLEVFWIDVEGGGATLIVTPAGESVLVDTGFPGGRDAARIRDLATKVAGLTRIDHVVVTHYHQDHFGGLAELAALMPLGTLHDNGIDSAPEAERQQPELEAYRRAKVAQRLVSQPGQEIELSQAPGAAPVRLRFLAARQSLAAASPARPNATVCKELSEKPPDTSDNANSAVLLLELGPFRFFDGGDLTWNVEGRLVCPDDRVGPVDVYQTNHHGVDNSNNPVLVRTLRPEVVVFNNGPRKGGEPGTAALLKATASVKAIYQVHQNVRPGALNTDRARVANDKEGEADAGNHLRLTVEPRGEGYTMSVPSTGHRQEYRTHPSP
jgi:beta-lactamase superfamily II metal-dependent hydrolase